MCFGTNLSTLTEFAGMMKGRGLRRAEHEVNYYDQSVRGKVERRSEGREVRGEGRVRIMHYSWWLLGLREKGLWLDISIRDEHAGSRKGEKPERVRETRGE